MSHRSRSTLFLLEQLIVILIFAICAAACVKIFVASFVIVNNASDMNNALMIAESGAECYKATTGNASKVATVLGGVADGFDNAAVFYNDEWQTCTEADAAYELRLTALNRDDTPTSMKLCELYVGNINGEEIISFTVATGGSPDE